MIARVALVILAGLAFAAPAVHAETPDELRKAIDEHNAQIQELDKEIAQYEAQLTAVGTKKKTLQSAISSRTRSSPVTPRCAAPSRSRAAISEAETNATSTPGSSTTSPR